MAEVRAEMVANVWKVLVSEGDSVEDGVECRRGTAVIEMALRYHREDRRTDRAAGALEDTKLRGVA